MLGLASSPPTLVTRGNVHGITSSAHEAFYYDAVWLE
jgi:hypothetical protein